jgi:hypothetical protein
MSARLARSSDVMTRLRSSHWLTPNWSRMSWPFRTRNFSSNFSFSSRCHWKARFAGQTIRMRSARPRSSSSRMSRPDHDRLARAGVVGQQEPHARELEQVVVDRLELVRQRVDARDRQAEVGIELVGDAERVGLEAEPQEPPVPVVRVPRVEDRESLDLGRGKRHPAKALRARSD